MVESWKNNLLNLPDQIFFDIIHNYLGELKTPFNKHDLLRSLTTLISKKEVRQQIFCLLDHNDIRLLTAIAMLGQTNIEELYKITDRYYSFLEIHGHIENLQERLLICVEDNKLIKLNPIFEEELKNGYLDTGLIFNFIINQKNISRPWFNEQFISAFISFLSNNRSLLHNGTANIRKLTQNFVNIFPTLPKDSSEDILLLIKTIENLGFITDSTPDFKIDIKKIESFGTLPVEDRTAFLAGSAIKTQLQEKDISLKSAAEVTSLLFKIFKQGSSLHIEDLRALIRMILTKTENRHENTDILSNELIIKTLIDSGFIIKDEDLIHIADLGISFSNPTKIIIQSNFELSAPPFLGLSDEITTAVSAEIKNYDITRTYQITRTSFAEALRYGLSREDILKKMKENIAGEIPQNILFSLKAWEDEYQSIKLNHGVVMVVGPERLPLIEHSSILKKYFIDSPAKGVFILDPERESEWRKALIEEGFDMLPKTCRINEKQKPDPITEKTKTDYMPLNGENGFETFSGGFISESGSIIEEIKNKISNLKITSDNKNKLEARAKKKLILTDAQLSIANKQKEIGEADGFDHRAKIRLVERALELNNLLEITRFRDLEIEKQLIKPIKIIKTETEEADKPPFYQIESIILPGENNITIPITRISHMKMLKSSLFTP